LTFWLSLDGEVMTLAVDGNGRLDLGGCFTHLNSLNRIRLEKIDLGTQQVLLWSASTDAAVRAIVLSGQRVVIGGYFSNVDDSPAKNMVAVDASTGAMLT